MHLHGGGRKVGMDMVTPLVLYPTPSHGACETCICIKILNLICKLFLFVAQSGTNTSHTHIHTHKRAHGHSHVITFALHTASQHPKDQCCKQCSWTTEESFCHPPPRLGGNGDAFLRVVPLDCAEHRFILCCTVDEGWFAPFSVILAVAWWPIVPEKNEERPFGVNPS